MTHAVDGRRTSDSARAAEALALVALSFAALATIGARVSAHGLAGVVVAEVGCVLVPTVAWLAWRRVPAPWLGLRRPLPIVATVGGLVAGAGAFYLVAVGLERWLDRVWPMPPALRDTMRRMIVPDDGARPLALDLVSLALIPALAEELLFRGVLLGAIRPRVGVTGAIVVSAVVFGVYHGSIYRFAPAALGGLLLGVVRVTSGGLAPAIAFHFANNAGVILALHLGYDTPPLTAGPIAVAALALAAGAALLARRGAGVNQPASHP